MVYGMFTPFVLRRVVGCDENVDGERFHLVGEAYVHGLMGGEGMCVRGEGVEAREFVLE